MKNYQVIFTDVAYIQLRNIRNYIANVLFNKPACKKFNDNIDDHIKILEIEPHMYSYVQGNRKYRKAIVKNYIMLFFIDERNKKVYISEIVYGRSDYLRHIK